MTLIGNGISGNQNSVEAAQEACSTALEKFNGQAPDLVFVFASTNYDYKSLLEEIKKQTNAKNIVGCSTAGEFVQDKALTGSVCIMAISSDSIKFDAIYAKNIKNDFNRVIDENFSNFRQETKTMLYDNDYRYPTVMMLIDGLVGQGEEFVGALHAKTGILTQIVGGGAGDDVKLKETYLFYDTDVFTEGVILIKIFSKNKISIGVSHGMENDTKKMKVTKSIGGVVYELDGKPALEVYKEYALTKDIKLTDENTGLFLISNELAIQDSTFSKIRAPLSANPDGSLNMATELPQGSLVTIVKSTKENLLNAAKTAAIEAKKGLDTENSSGILVFDCICRQIIMGENYVDEIKEIAHVFGNDTPVTGFSTYGEIAKYRGALNGYHNSTVVVCAFPA